MHEIEERLQASQPKPTMAQEEEEPAAERVSHSPDICRVRLIFISSRRSRAKTTTHPQL